MAVAIACSFIQTRLDYCNALLSSNSDGNIARLQRVQNCAARIVLRKGRRTSAAPLLRSLHWLPIADRIRFKVAVLSYKAISTGQPSYLRNLLIPCAPARALRSGTRSLLKVPPCPLVACRPAFSISAPTIWNSLSDHTRAADTLTSFRSRLKTELFLGPL